MTALEAAYHGFCIAGLGVFVLQHRLVQDGLMEPDLEAARRRLEEKKLDLDSMSALSQEARAPVSLDQQSVGRLSRMDAMQGQAMALATRQRQEQRLRKLIAALRRIDEDDYGYCEDCGKPVDPRRLEIDPATLFCLECASARD